MWPCRGLGGLPPGYTWSAIACPYVWAAASAEGNRQLYALLNELGVPTLGAESLAAWPPESVAETLPAFPAIDRDLTVLVEEQVRWADLEAAIDTNRPASLEAIEFVTVFRGRNLPTGRKAVTLRLRFRVTDRTLRHDEIDPEIATITAALATGVGGEIRQ